VKTRLLDGEQLVKKFDGYLSRGEWNSEGTCYLTDHRLVFEEPDREGGPEVEVNWNKLVKRSIVGGVLAGGLGGGLGGASSVEVKKGPRIEGIVHVFWFDQLARVDPAGMEIAATLQSGQETGQVLIKVKKEEEQLTLEEQERVRTMVETAKDRARLQREREATMNQKLSLLKELNMKKGFLNPDMKLDHDILRKMDSGKTREQAIEELYREATSSG
jgi:hypothetical protein